MHSINPTDSPRFRTCSILGTPMALIDYSGAVAVTQHWAADRTRAYAVDAANTHGITLSRHDPQFRQVLDQFDLMLPDGMPIVWCMNWLTRNDPQRSEPLKDRVYGPTYMLRCLEQSEGKYSHFLLGGSEEVLEDLQLKLRTRFPELQIAGAYSPPFGGWPEEENEKIFEKIRQSEANYIWVGLGCPKQEQWIGRNKKKLPPGVYSAVGAAFAFHAGRVSQAPMWIQSHGLEWAYRIWTEPRRLFKRYATFISLFCFYSVVDFVRNRFGKL